MAVDWSHGNQAPYGQAVENTQVVGAVIHHLLRAMFARGLSPEHVHLIGHSLGAHIAGYAGRDTSKLGRISGLGMIYRCTGSILPSNLIGLDPAGPQFYKSSADHRLDPTDAVFVDVIHTDGAADVISGFGTWARLGHVDFYPNGGAQQTGGFLLQYFRTSANLFLMIRRMST